MLKAARRAHGRPRERRAAPGDLEALPIETGGCDAALLVLALSYVEDPRRRVAEMARVLRPGGRAVVVDLLRHDREDFRRQMGQQRLGFEPEDARGRLLRAAGLAATRRCAPLPPEPEAKGPALLLATAERDRRRHNAVVAARRSEPGRKK